MFEAACETAAWGRALELYRGDLLAGVFIADVSADFEHWLEDERRRLRRRAAEAAWSAGVRAPSGPATWRERRWRPAGRWSWRRMTRRRCGA